MNHVQIIITSWYEYSSNNMVLILYASILIGERKSWRGLSFIINLTLKNDIFEYRIKGGRVRPRYFWRRGYFNLNTYTRNFGKISQLLIVYFLIDFYCRCKIEDALICFLVWEANVMAHVFPPSQRDQHYQNIFCQSQFKYFYITVAKHSVLVSPQVNWLSHKFRQQNIFSSNYITLPETL